MTAQEVLTLRLALCANGYTPLPLYGKEPPIYGKNNKRQGLDKWQLLDNITHKQLEMWGLSWPDASNTGILTRLTPVLDADILNQDAAVAVENLVRERFEERGYILVRIGLAPKRAILFRTLNPFDKITVNFTKTRSKAEKIELLCDGQQLVAEGTHPETGKSYSWFGGTPWEIAHDDLPYISEEEARQLVEDVVEMLCRDFGYVRDQAAKTKTVRTNDGTRPASDNYAITALERECAAVVNARPGNRNEQLNKSAFNLGQLIEDGLLDEKEVCERLYNAAVACGYVKDDGEKAALNTIESGISGGKNKPRTANSGNVQPQPLPSPLPASSSPPPPPPPSPPPPPPQSPGAQSAGPQPSGPSSSTSPIEDTLKIFREWLQLDSDIPVLAVLGTIAANMLPGDPVWLGLVAPPSSAKTEILITLARIPNLELVGTLSLPGLLSGTPRRQHAAGARGGLLQKIGAFGFIVLKDFGSILSMRPDTKGEVLSALREIYDGHWSRAVGADGGKILSWSGKIGLLFGCTKVVDSHHSFIQKLGDRFLYCRLEPDPDQFLHASKHIGAKTTQMRRQLTEAVANLFATPLPPPQELTDTERDEINEDLKLAVRLRGEVERDRYTRELEDIYGAEGTGRLGLTLERLLAGLSCLGIERTAARDVIKTVAFDSVPPNRLRVYRHLESIKPSWADTATVANVIQLPTGTARRALEDLVAYDLAEKGSMGQGNPTLWRAF